MTEENQEVVEEVEVENEVSEDQEHADFLAASNGDSLPDANEEVTEEANEFAGIPDSVIASIESKLTEKLTGQIEQKLSGRLRNIEGHIGGLKHGLTQLSTARKAAEDQGAETPTKAQIREAAKSGEKMKALKDEFGDEFGEALEEAINTATERTPKIDIEGINQRIQSTKESAENLMYKARQMARLDTAFPDWEQTISTDAYRNWLLNQPQEIQVLTSSDSSADAIKVLKAYSDASQPSLTASSRQNNRLENAITPTSGGSVTKRKPLTEHEAFLAAYNSD